MANIISIFRIFLVFIAISLLMLKPSNIAYLSALILTILAFSLDGLDGYIARKFNETSKLGAVLDIMGDRIAEYAYWIVFSCLGFIPVVFPLIAITRGVVTDSLRSVALEQGYIPFGKGSMLNDKVSQWICGSKFMKIGYAVVKALAFSLIIIANSPIIYNSLKYCWHVSVVANVLSEIAILVCVIRGIPVLFEGRRFLNKGTD